MEKRGKTYHQARIAESIKNELSALIEGELGDPRIGLATVREVILSPDGKSVRVFVTAVGNDEEGKRTVEGLMAAKGYIRHELRDRLGVRHVPELMFILDRSEAYGARIDQLLHRVEERDRKRKKS